MVKVVLWAAVVCLLIGYSQVVQSWKAMPPTRQGLLSKSSLSAAQNYNNELQKTLYRNLFPQPTWRLREKAENVKVVDVLAVLSRFDKREDFYQGKGYSRALGLLNNDDFYEKIKSLPYKRWPLDQNGNPYALDKSLSKQEFEQLQKEVKATVPSKAATDAVFTSFAKGATNGVAYPKQVDEEMEKWLEADGKFNLNNFQLSLLLGRLYVFIGWFLYIGLQFGGVYVVFFVPIMSQFFPEVDFYPIQTYLHTSEWGK